MQVFLEGMVGSLAHALTGLAGEEPEQLEG
jgi:hypothetical protein